ncbi:MAG: TonB-dependent receptor [Bacteroidales bacterium]|nr:TonB-dependent receptor [Bacteroidales bacterium]
MKKSLMKIREIREFFPRKVILLLLSLMFISAAAFSQNERFNFRADNIKLRDLLDKIQTQSSYKFLYRSDLVNSTYVKINVLNASLQDVLKHALEETSLTYQIMDDKLIVISLKGATAPQAQKISGKITDYDTGESMVGVSVVVKGTSKGVITDLDGNFSIDVDRPVTLVFSYIGYLKQNLEVTNQSTLNVKLMQDIKRLDEVVVIGYGTQRKGDLTSSVGSVKKEDFIQGAVKDAGQLVQGKVAGLTITNTSGDPTSSTTVSLRGNTTILGASTNPLILVDGIPGDLNTVAPEDIESVDVLKDGSAAAIYGSRGTNGVILITTKKAKGDNINQVEYSAYMSTSSIAKRLEMNTSGDYRQQISDGIRDASWDLGNNVDWMDLITRTPFNHVHNLSLKGGNQQTNYIVNLNYRSNQGIMERSDMNKFQGRAEINHNMFDSKLKLNFGLLGNQNKYTSTSDGGSWNTYIYRQALIHNPTEPIKNEDGTWYENTGIYEYANPLALLYEADGEQNIFQLRVNGGATFNPIKDFTLKALVSYDKSNQYGGYYETKNHISTIRDSKNGYASVGSNIDETKLIELTAQYQKKIGGHNLTVLGGYSWQGTDYSIEYEQNYDFPTDIYSYNNIGQGAALKEGLGTMYSYSIQTNLISFFGRLSYSYKDRYLLMAALRHEGASQLAGTNNAWGTFPSVSLGWRITEEPFMKTQTLFNDLKLRAGYGVTGSQPSDSFLGMSMLSYGDYYYYNGKWIQGLQPSQNANPDLKWEEKHETNIGVDFSVLDSRISGSIDLYDRTIKGLLYDYSVPSPPNLYTTTRANVGKMSNKGIEVLVNFNPVRTKDLNWNSTVTFSTNTNKLISLSNDLYQTTSDYFVTGWIQEPVKTESHIVKVGKSIGGIYGFKVVDVDDSGKWIYEDKDGNHVGYDDFTHSTEDKKVIGNGLPKYYAGWNNSIRYKNWDLSVSMRGAFGFQIINSARMFYENLSRSDWNRLKSAYDPVFGKVRLNSLCSEEFNSYYVENGDYWKIDNITLGYNFKRIGKYIKNFRMYVSSQNVLTITGYKGTDPEVSVSGLNPGYDNRDQYPHVRSYTLGANITF